MKILQVYKDVFPEVNGGIERYIHDLSLFLNSRGHTVQILVAGGGRRQIGTLEVEGVWSPFRILSNPVAPGYTRFLEQTDADVVHFHLPLPSAVTAMSAIRKKLRKPYVVTYHSDIVRQAFLMPFYGPVLRRFLTGAAGVIATSDNYIRSSEYLRNLSNCESIPIGVNLDIFKPDSKVEKKHYLFVGRFRKYKGIFVLLEAWKKMNNPPDLILAGGGGLIQRVRENIKLNKLPVSIMSDVSDSELVKLYQGAKALILPSILRSEAYGMVQVEAMACGTPVISSDLPTGVTFINNHNETGLHFATGNSSELTRAVEKLEESHNLRMRLSENALLKAHRLFSGSALFEKVEECLIKATKI